MPHRADPKAKIRSLAQEYGDMEMTPKMRAYLQRIGMDEKATDEEARGFYEALLEGARKRADAYVVEISEEEEESEMEMPEAPQRADEGIKDDEKERADGIKMTEGEDLAKISQLWDAFVTACLVPLLELFVNVGRAPDSGSKRS